MKERILEALSRLGFATREQILKTARIFDASEMKSAKKTIEELVDSGEIMLSARGKLALPAAAGVVKGKVISNPKGFAFVRPETEGEDVFVAERDLNGAAHGDVVLVQTEQQKQNKSPKKSHFQAKTFFFCLFFLLSSPIIIVCVQYL